MEKKLNAYEMGTEYSGLRYSTFALTGGLAACKKKASITHFLREHR